MKTITNREQILEQLTEMLMQFDKDMNGYQTDVYLYYDEESGEAKLSTFINVGGNSWLNDDHYTVHRDREHNEDEFDAFQSISDVAEAVEMSEEDLCLAATDGAEEYLDESSYSDVRWYVQSREDLMEKLTKAYGDLIDDNRCNYEEQAEQILSTFEEENDFE